MVHLVDLNNSLPAKHLPSPIASLGCAELSLNIMSANYLRVPKKQCDERKYQIFPEKENLSVPVVLFSHMKER